MKKPEIDPELKLRLKQIKAIPMRDANAEARGRRLFLKEASLHGPPVPAGIFQRLREWSIFHRKETPILMKFFTATAIVVLVLASGTITAHASQDDLPDQPLYGVKLFLEDFQLWVNQDAQAEVEILMQLAQNRVAEMIRLSSAGIVPPVKVRERLEAHIQEALQACAGMDDTSMLGNLERIRLTLQEQDRLMEQVQTQTQLHADVIQTMTRTREMIQNRIRQMDGAGSDPQGFRNTLQYQYQYRTIQTGTPIDHTNPAYGQTYTPNGNGAGGQGNNGSMCTGTPGASCGTTCTPSYGNGPGPNTPPGNMGTPQGTPGDTHGTCTCTPGTPSGKQGTPTPGDAGGYGSGTGTPSGNQGTPTPNPTGGGNHP